MLNYELNRAESILILKPIGPLESTDAALDWLKAEKREE
jgi:hypothetical protein